jgi:hypothetical protein
LTSWASSRRRLILLAGTFDDVARRHPRWVAWRRDWSHTVSCRVNDELEASAVPSVLIAQSTVSVRLSDTVHHRGRVSHERADELHCRELVDAVLQRSQETFPATATGL